MYLLQSWIKESVGFAFYNWIAFWFLVPICAKYFPSKNSSVDHYVTATRIVSMMHSCVAAPLATYIWAMSPGDDSFSIHQKHLGFSAHVLLSWSLGYFIWDLLISLMYPKKMGRDVIAHALLCTIGYALALQPFLAREAVGLLMFEWSTPCLNLYRLAQSQRWGFKVEYYSMVGFAILFVLFRLVWGTPYVLFWIYPRINSLSPSLSLTIWSYLSSSSSVALNWFWFYKMYCMTLRKNR